MAKYDAGGKLAWKRRLELQDAGGVAVDGSGNVFISANNPGSTTRAAVVAKYDGDGHLVWKRVVDNAPGEKYTANTVATDVGYEFEETIDAWVVKLDADGHLEWKRFVFGQLTYEIEKAYGVAVDANGDVIVGGYLEYGSEPLQTMPGSLSTRPMATCDGSWSSKPRVLTASRCGHQRHRCF